MARVQRNAKLQTREARTRLKFAHEPYWHAVRPGLAVGYRKGRLGGTWWLREYRDHHLHKRRIGQADDVVDADGVDVLSWTGVLKAALGDDRATRQPTGRYAVDDALNAYFDHRAAKSPPASVATDKGKAKEHIRPKLGELEVNELSSEELLRWRNALIPKSEDPELRRRAQATANRCWTILRAALNLAFENGTARSADAWRRIRAFRNVDRPRRRFLNVEECSRLLNASPPDFRQLAQGALSTGLRVGELLALKSADVVDGAVHVHHSKSGKARVVPLSKEGRKFFDQVLAGNVGDQPVFLRADGERWHRPGIAKMMKYACARAKIKPAVTFHDLRRSYGSILINGGVQGEVIQRLLGHADMRMTLRVYSHLLDVTVRTAVEENLPSFGLAASKVRKIRP